MPAATAARWWLGQLAHFAGLYLLSRRFREGIGLTAFAAPGNWP
jgi:hypothetical protein